jgi:hypothetical protein
MKSNIRKQLPVWFLLLLLIGVLPLAGCGGGGGCGPGEVLDWCGGGYYCCSPAGGSTCCLGPYYSSLTEIPSPDLTYATLEGPVDFGTSWLKVNIPEEGDSLIVPVKGKIAMMGGVCSSHLDCNLEVVLLELTPLDKAYTTSKGHTVKDMFVRNVNTWKGVRLANTNLIAMDLQNQLALEATVDGDEHGRVLNPNAHFEGQLFYASVRAKGGGMGLVQNNKLMITGEFTDGTVYAEFAVNMWLADCQPTVTADVACTPNIETDCLECYDSLVFSSEFTLLGNLQSDQDLCEAMLAADPHTVCWAEETGEDVTPTTFHCATETLPPASNKVETAKHLDFRWVDAHGFLMSDQYEFVIDYSPAFPVDLTVTNKWGRTVSDELTSHGCTWNVRLKPTYHICLKSYHSSYLGAEPDGAAQAKRPWASAWETWKLIDIDGGQLESGDRVHLLGRHGRYLVAESGGAANADRSWAREWETWELIDGNGGQLQSGDPIHLLGFHGNYLVAEPDGAANANRPWAEAWETWTFIAEDLPQWRTVRAINCGGEAAGSFETDTGFMGGATWRSGALVDTTGTLKAAPGQVYQTERHGTDFTYQIGGLRADQEFIVRLHFAEIFFYGVGQRVFDVLINGVLVLDDYDIFERAGTRDRSVIEEFRVSAAAGGIDVQFVGMVDNAMCSAIELLTSSDEPVAWWGFDETSGTVAYDAMGSNHATVHGAMWTEGHLGGALWFDGIDDMVTTPVVLDQTKDSPGATLCAWVYPESYAYDEDASWWGLRHVVGSDDGGHDWSMLCNSDGRWLVFTGEGGRDTGFTVDLDQWQFIAAVFEPGSGVTFHKNSDKAVVPFIGYDTSTNSFAVGDNPGPWPAFFAGKIDDVQIYEGALSDETVKSRAMGE